MKKILLFFVLTLTLILSFNYAIAENTCSNKHPGYSCIECGNNCGTLGCISGECRDNSSVTNQCCPAGSATKSGLARTADIAGLKTQKTPKDMATTIVGYALGIVGILVFVNIIIAGYQWITAGGNEETITQAKAKIKNSVLGLIIILAAYVITSNLFTIIKDVVT
ncbi:MAG TPA: pilin [bacterium]|jgi:pectate lyase|nr:pilin [bacterium]HOG38593.1 pilin [bacterium]